MVDDATSATRVGAPKSSQATNDDPFHELTALYRSLQRQFKQAELRLRASLQLSADTDASTVLTPPSRGPSPSTTPGHTITPSRSLCWGELQGACHGYSQPVREMEGSVWHDHGRRRRMLGKLVADSEHVPMPVTTRPDSSPPVDECLTRSHRRSRRAMTAIIRGLRQQVSDLKAGATTMDSGTQTYQYDFVSDKGVQAPCPEDFTPRILRRGCALGSTPGAPAASDFSASSSISKPLVLSHIQCRTLDEDREQRKLLRARHKRDSDRADFVRRSRGEARPGQFKVGGLVLSLPLARFGDDPHDVEYLLFSRVHRVVEVWSHTDRRRGYEVCRVRPEFPYYDHFEEKSIQSRFLEPLAAEDWEVAEREFYKAIRYRRAEILLGRIGFRGYDGDYYKENVRSVVFPDGECECCVCCSRSSARVSCIRGSLDYELRDVHAPPRKLLYDHLKSVFSRTGVVPKYYMR